MFQKILSFFLVPLVLFGLTSCSLSKDLIETLRWIESDQKTADRTIARLLEGIQNQDQNAVKNLFSKDVVEEVSDFDKEIEALFHFVEGETLSYDGGDGVPAEMMRDHGKKRKEINSSYVLKADQQEYYIAVKECTVDTFEPKRVGIRSVYIIDADDWQTNFTYWGGGKWAPGITIEYGEDIPQ